MKKIIIATAVALFAIGATVSIYAVFNSSTAEIDAPILTPIEEIYNRELFPAREGAEAEKTFAVNDREEQLLSYAYTHDRSDGGYLDIYVDSDLNEYHFDKNGDYVGYIGNTQVSADGDAFLTVSDGQKMDEKLAVAAAEEHAREMYGDRFDGMALVDVYESDAVYTVKFARQYGDECFVYGAVCNTVIGKDGVVITSQISESEKHDGFDGSLCADLTEDEAAAYAEAEAAERFSQYGITNTEVLGIQGNVVDGKSVIVVNLKISAESWPSKEDIEEYGLAVANSIDPIFGWNCIYELEG